MNLQPLRYPPNADEWSYFIRGSAKVMTFNSSGTARTFKYRSKNVGIVPKNIGHYVENIRETEEVEF